MAYKCKADNSNCLHNAWLEDRKALLWIALEFGWNVLALDENAPNDDDHAYERKARCAGEFVNVPIE